MTRIILRLGAFILLVGSSFGQDAKPPSETAGTTSRTVTIIEYADFQCPFCAQQAPDVRKLQAEYPGTLTVTFKNFPLPFHKQSRAAHLAALAAGEQGKFWDMHDLIYQSPEHLAISDLDRYAAKLGLDLEKFHRSVEDPGQSKLIDKDIAGGHALGINATPTFVVDGHTLVGRQSYARLKQIIAAELKGESWMNPDPVSIDASNAPSQGLETAAVTIVEFSDFECPYCARAVPEVRRIIRANHDNVRFVFKNFPLDIHPDSQLAHMAALAAGEQGKFWPMHDLIFAHQKTIKREDLMGFAAQLSLDMKKFQADLESPLLQARIQSDKQEGERIGVNATPTFYVNGEEFSGFSAERMQTQIDQEVFLPRPDQAQVTAALPDLDLTLGPKDAPIRVLWYADLTSPLTAKSAIALQQFMAAHVGAVRVEFKNFPLQSHPSALLVHEFALAAAAQGKFWTVESLLLSDPKPKDREELKALAFQAGIDQRRLWSEVNANKYASFISNNLKEARKAGVTGSPTFVVGDRKLDGVNALSALDHAGER